MKKLVMFAAVLLGAAATSQAGIGFSIGFDLPFPQPGFAVFGRSAPCLPAPVIYPRCEPIYRPAPCVVAASPIYGPAPVVVTRKVVTQRTVVSANPAYSQRVVYADRGYGQPRGYGYGYDRGYDRWNSGRGYRY